MSLLRDDQSPEEILFNLLLHHHSRIGEIDQIDEINETNQIDEMDQRDQMTK